jgi:phosphoribosylpyrophosphate synthetase
MTTDTKIKILGYLKTNGQARVCELADHLGIGKVALHRQLKSLVEIGKLAKSGSAPKVFYTLAIVSPDQIKETHVLLDKYFAYVDPTGQLRDGLTGFRTWLSNVSKSEQENSLLSRYIKDRDSANALFSSEGWIDATANVSSTFGSEMNLDGVYYSDFYSLPTFGKTRLGCLMLYSKQSENRELIAQTAEESKDIINKLINEKNIDAIGYLPHSILRKVQFLKEFAKKLNLALPVVEMSKAYPGKIRVAQKTLGKLEERVRNAKETIFVDKINSRYNNLLLIDDAVGSAATLNETAKKLKQMGIAQKVYGFAVVGSLKGFEVIREV